MRDQVTKPGPSHQPGTTETENIMGQQQSATFVARVTDVTRFVFIDQDDWDTGIFQDTITVYDETGRPVGSVVVESSDNGEDYDRAVTGLIGNRPFVWDTETAI